jgi:hypothetical protein
MPGDELWVATDLLSGSVFAPYMDYMREVVEGTHSEIRSIGPLVPRQAAEIDEYVVKLEKQNVPLVLDVLAAVQNLPRGDADSAERLASLLENLEDHNTKEAGSGFHSGHHA